MNTLNLLLFLISTNVVYSKPWRKIIYLQESCNPAKVSNDGNYYDENILVVKIVCKNATSAESLKNLTTLPCGEQVQHSEDNSSSSTSSEESAEKRNVKCQVKQLKHSSSSSSSEESDEKQRVKRQLEDTKKNSSSASSEETEKPRIVKDAKKNSSSAAFSEDQGKNVEKTVDLKTEI